MSLHQNNFENILHLHVESWIPSHTHTALSEIIEIVNVIHLSLSIKSQDIVNTQ